MTLWKGIYFIFTTNLQSVSSSKLFTSFRSKRLFYFVEIKYISIHKREVSFVIGNFIIRFKINNIYTFCVN